MRAPRGGIASETRSSLYLKPVVLLVDRGTFSAAEDFISVMRATGHVTLVGEKDWRQHGKWRKGFDYPGRLRSKYLLQT